MKNFGFTDLWLVRPCKLGPQAKAMAVHAGDVLRWTRKVKTLDAALAGARLVVGTTARDLPETSARGPLVEPGEMRRRAEAAGGRVVLLLGPEDHGLRVEELERCDLVVRIPTHSGYSSMNVSHAAALLLYELAGLESRPVPRATKAQVEGFLEHFDQTLRDVDFPAPRRKRTVNHARKMAGRANPTAVEVRVLRGALRGFRNTLRIAREKNSSGARKSR